MNDKIPLPISKKQFRGITRVTLYDVDTGEIQEQVVEENLYNQRLQVLSYLDTILKCVPLDYANTSIIELPLAEESATNIRGGTNNHIAPWGVSGGTGSNDSLFNTLWLTNNTADANVLGYPNGVPIAVADNGGVPVTVYNCVGTISLNDSYVANDRIHMEWNFTEDEANYTFDSVWLYPSATRNGSGVGQRMHGVRLFFDVQLMSSKIAAGLTVSNAYTNFRLREMQAPYVLMEYRTSAGSPYTTPLIQIYNERTAELIKSYSFSGTLPPANTPLWWDESSDTLWQINVAARSGNFIWEDGTTSNGYLIKINLATGESTQVLLRTLLGFTMSEYNFSSSTATATDIMYLSDGTVPLLGVSTTGVDSVSGSTAAYYTWFSFDPLTETFTRINKVRCYSWLHTTTASGLPAAGINTTQLIDNLLYLSAYTSATPDPFNYITVFNVKTGAIVNNNGISLTTGATVYSNIRFNEASGILGYTRILYDLQKYKFPRLNTTLGAAGVTTSGVQFIQEQYFTAPWSTHNKLTSPITKASSQTMKVEYDVIWDSIEDVLLPALL